MILHNQCLPTELVKPANKTAIAQAFNDCTGTPLTAGVRLAKCTDLGVDTIIFTNCAGITLATIKGTI